MERKLQRSEISQCSTSQDPRCCPDVEVKTKQDEDEICVFLCHIMHQLLPEILPLGLVHHLLCVTAPFGAGCLSKCGGNSTASVSWGFSSPEAL